MHGVRSRDIGCEIVCERERVYVQDIVGSVPRPRRKAILGDGERDREKEIVSETVIDSK